MAFHEKSAWAILLGITVVFVPYFLVVFWAPPAFIGLLPIATVVLSVLLVGYHIVTAIVTSSVRKRGDVPPQDELEKLIELRAAKLSGFVLAVLVLSWYLVTAFGMPVYAANAVSNMDGSSALLQPSIPVLHAMTALNILFAGFVAANVVYYSAIIAGYRRLTLGVQQ